MKRVLAGLLLLIILAVLLGCTGTTVVYNCTCEESQEAVLPEKGAVKTGLGLHTTISGENAAPAEEGYVVLEVGAAAVHTDASGVITACKLDGLMTRVFFDDTGTCTRDAVQPVSTAKTVDGGTDAWSHQAIRLEEYAIGKTAEELRSLEREFPEVWVVALEKACENAQYLGAGAEDVLKLAGMYSLETAARGSISLDWDAAAVTVREDTVCSCYLDALQVTVLLDEAGHITTDLSAPVETKNQLKERYGMKAYGGARYEWYQQAANFATYVTGKTLPQIQGIAVTPEGKAQEVDLASQVTIAITGFRELVCKAMQE